MGRTGGCGDSSINRDDIVDGARSDICEGRMELGGDVVIGMSGSSRYKDISERRSEVRRSPAGSRDTRESKTVVGGDVSIAIQCRDSIKKTSPTCGDGIGGHSSNRREDE